uniref:Uncharacterized protein n=1 Tax=Acrobeloides nanus TaxID=290746 RepID=A0A914E4A1_9BILA
MLCVLFSLCLLGGSFLLINKDSAAVHQIQGNVPNFDQSIDLFSQCNSYSNCDFCVTNEYCGFCVQQGNEKSWGYCLPGKNNQSDVRSDTGYCNSPTSSDTDNYHYNISIDGKPTRWEWDDSFCHTKYTFLPIAIIVIYQISFTSGINQIVY